MSERKHTIFISHVPDDRDLADYLARDLQAQGVSVWHASSKLKTGQKWVEAIEDALGHAEFFILVISPSALKSAWASFEAGVALSRAQALSRRRLLSVLTHGVTRGSLPAALRQVNAIEMEGAGLGQVSRRVAAVVVATVKGDDEHEGNA